MYDLPVTLLAQKLRPYLVGHGVTLTVGPPTPADVATVFLTVLSINKSHTAPHTTARIAQNPEFAQHPGLQPFEMTLLISFAGANQQKHLAVLGAIAHWLDQNSYWKPDNTPEMPPELDRMSLESIDFPLPDMLAISAAFGSPSLPAMCQKMRVAPNPNADIRAVALPIVEPE